MTDTLLLGPPPPTSTSAEEPGENDGIGPLSPRGIPWDDEDPEALLDWVIAQHESPERAAELSAATLRAYAEAGLTASSSPTSSATLPASDR